MRSLEMFSYRQRLRSGIRRLCQNSVGESCVRVASVFLCRCRCCHRMSGEKGVQRELGARSSRAAGRQIKLNHCCAWCEQGVTKRCQVENLHKRKQRRRPLRMHTVEHHLIYAYDAYFGQRASVRVGAKRAQQHKQPHAPESMSATCHRQTERNIPASHPKTTTNRKPKITA